MVLSVRRPVLVGTVLAVVLAAALTVLVGVRAIGSDPTRCERFVDDSRARAATDTGTGQRVVVIGDSWSAGLGLDRAAGSWPSRLAGAVHVAGFSGSGFSAHASPCGVGVSFAERAPRALRGGADLVVVEGGLNDYDQSDAAVRAGFRALMRELSGQQVVIVGPASAPSRVQAVPHVDVLLARLAERYDVPYVQTSGLQLTYLPDRLHLTPAAHDVFGDYVAEELAGLGLA
ncbi:SGNH/GDSL hydrolase family protein [Nocardioides sp. YIM 152315]|uniref:SGNH/GDSL hydrolase family protein n=1 Tax=Nocardioides sp. YIM 152315 TaxID=3031760 RepID=UPI0023D98CCA|nr:SGNH/GDSL hydrolase family protein [Nocardioides sp. YIM 152315]MDF1605698.1 SGNH/GDSL hydrolase family protein [Nocardioides sp. YIM 152315]